METRRTSFLPILLIAAQFSIYFNSTIPTQAQVVSATIYEKTFSQKFAAIEIENANGRTEVETWNSNRVRVAASCNTIADGRPISARIHFQVSDTGLKIQVREDRNEQPVSLLVFVPREINLAVTGDSNTEYQVTVRMRGSDTHDSYVTAREQLKRIADETGGTLFKADRAEDLDGVYQRVASELQTLYSVSYNPADKNYDGKWRKVGVKVKQGTAMARTKRGFHAR